MPIRRKSLDYLKLAQREFIGTTIFVIVMEVRSNGATWESFYLNFQKISLQKTPWSHNLSFHQTELGKDNDLIVLLKLPRTLCR